MLAGLKDVISGAQSDFQKLLEGVDQLHPSGISEAHYVRYLSMQFNLVRGVQVHFRRMAEHPAVRKYPNLSSFLSNFANEEEMHFKIAEVDIGKLGKSPLPAPIDVNLWWAFFDSVVERRPFVRLGATCVLENIAGPSDALITRMMAKAQFLNHENTRFLQVHRHQENAHGDEILKMLGDLDLEKQHVTDIEEGAKVARKLFVRFVSWSFEFTHPQISYF